MSYGVSLDTGVETLFLFVIDICAEAAGTQASPWAGGAQLFKVLALLILLVIQVIERKKKRKERGREEGGTPPSLIPPYLHVC